jgi:hypothetical protein
MERPRFTTSRISIKSLSDTQGTTHGRRTLFGAVFIHAIRCAITSGEIRTLPEIYGVARASVHTPSVYVPDSFPIVSRHDLPLVEALLASEVNELDQLKDRLAVAQKSLDVDTGSHPEN